MSADVNLRTEEMKLTIPTSTGGRTLELFQLVGIGGTSIVYSATDLEIYRNFRTSDEIPMSHLFALKVYRNVDVFNTESDYCGTLVANKLNQLNDCTFYGDTRIQVAVLPLLHPITTQGFIHPQQQVHRATYAEFRELLKWIRKMHDAGIVHGDIRAQNIAYDGEKLVLLDFGFARKEDDEGRSYCGTVETASSRIMKLLNGDPSEAVSVQKRDDLESFYKCCTAYMENRTLPRSWKDLALYWGTDRMIARFDGNDSYQEFYDAFDQLLAFITNNEFEITRNAWSENPENVTPKDSSPNNVTAVGNNPSESLFVKRLVEIEAPLSGASFPKRQATTVGPSFKAGSSMRRSTRQMATGSALPKAGSPKR